MTDEPYRHELPRPEDLARAYGELLDRQPAVEEGSLAAGAEAASTPPPMTRIIEALLFLGGPPLTPERAVEVVRGLSPAHLQQTIDALNRDYRGQGRPYRIRYREHGYELALLPRFRDIYERLYGSVREARLSPVALDALALVAYRQPVTRSEVDSLRGFDSSAPLRHLVRLGLIAVQRGDADGQEVAYATTARFLALFGLRGLDDLPRTEDAQRL